MNYTFPIVIENGSSERIKFKEIVNEPDGAKVLLEGICKPGGGPLMHVHYKQDEGMTVIKGKMGYQIKGEPEKFITEGESVQFNRNQPHRFWNDGNDDLILEGWVKPANSIIFFLTTLYEAQKKSRNGRPELFDSAFLLTRYKGEYGMTDLPPFVRSVIIPLVYWIGKSLGKYKKFEDAPAPLK